MILPWLIAIPIVGGFIALFAARLSVDRARAVALASLGLDLVLAVSLWMRAATTPGGRWVAEYNASWVPQTGISFHLAADGLSLPLVVLTAFIGLVAVVVGWREISERVGVFHFLLLWVLAGIIGVFLSLDLFLFAFFWELMLIPGYFLFFWGQGRPVSAGLKFLLFTQISGLLMLLGIVGLAFVHAQATGTLTFDYMQLLGTKVGPAVALWLMLGFFIAFAVKLPVFPFHTWAPDAYVAAPTPVAIVLSGLMAKTAGYGLLRFALPLFPTAAVTFAPVAMGLAVISILYAGWLAFGQTDFKRLIAYSSVAHMGFVMLGAFAANEVAAQGALMVMLAHGVSTTALFVVVAAVEARTGTRELPSLGGLWATTPRLAGLALLFALASLGLPGLGNFVGEFLVLLGTFRSNALLASIGAVGVVVATVYALWLIQHVFQGPYERGHTLPDVSGLEAWVLGVLAVVIVALGLFPQPVLDGARPVLVNFPGQIAVGPQARADGVVDRTADEAPSVVQGGGR
ncbi:MAG: complex I subunit 4 family protein [Chloroflexota bacterium]